MRHLALDRPLVFIDLETTGVNPATDRIIELSLLKVHPDGRRETFTCRLDPQIPIPAPTTRVHGIADADVAGAPRFAEIAPQVAVFIGDAHLGGFGIVRFDVPILRRELAAAGLDLEMTGRAVLDAQVIYHRRVPRDLAAAYWLYCGSVLLNHHSARADVEAAAAVLDAQLAAYPDLPRTACELQDCLLPTLPAPEKAGVRS